MSHFSRLFSLTDEEDESEDEVTNDCGHCMEGLGALCGDLKHDEVVTRTVQLLEGAAFCDKVNLAGCVDLIDLFIPLAVPLLGDQGQYHTAEVCTAMNICP